MQELMEPPPRPTVNDWFKSRVDWVSIGCNGVWRHLLRKLRVACDAVNGKYYVVPFDVVMFRDRYEELRIGPYDELQDTMLAAEMLKETGGTIWPTVL